MLPVPSAALPLLKYGGLILLAATLFFKGHSLGEDAVQQKWDLQKAKDETRIAVIEKNAAEASARAASAFAETRSQDREKTTTIIREINKYVPADPAGADHPSNVFVSLWNASNQGATLSRPPANPDGKAEGIGWHEIATQHGEESAYCREVEAQLSALQGWVLSSQEIYNKETP